LSPSAPTPRDDDQPPLYPDLEPEDVRYIRDVDTLRAISDATRMRILETMVQRREPGWSVKELAAALQVPQTRLYHHVELLLERDLIRPVERRVVSGIIETRYAAVATNFQLDRALFAADSDEGLAVLHETLRAVFDTARSELELAIRLRSVDASPDAPPDRRLLLSRGLTRLTAAHAGELRERLTALIDEFGEDDADDGASAWGLVVALYPMPVTDSDTDTDTEEPTDG
jgi:DNA-binding transcriptional ArsR family regulator